MADTPPRIRDSALSAVGSAAGIVFKLRFVWLPTVLLLLFTLPTVLLFGDLLPSHQPGG